jgi:hypothetical protein
MAFWSLAGCTTDTAAPMDAGSADDTPNATTPVDSGGPGADGGSPGGDSGPATDAHVGADAAAVGDDSGIVEDDAPAGCPGPVTGGTVPPPTGTLLVAGNSLSARGVTSDGYEVYSDDAARELYAIPVAGGAAQTIAALGSNFWVTVVGQVVFAWSNVTSANVGALTVWSSTQGAHAIAPASFGILGASSADGTQVLFVANVDAQGTSGDVYVAETNGSASTRLLQNQQLAGCFPQLGFAGSYAIASHCDAARGAGPSSTISSFRSPAWTQADLMGSAENIWSADTAGTMVLVSTGGGVQVVPIGGGAAKTIDPSGFIGQLIAGGQTAVYGTTSGALRRSSTVTPSPTTLAPSFGGFYAVSPSQDTVLYYETTTSAGSDAYLSSTLAAGTPVTVSSKASGAVLGDAFTMDSTYALYSSGSDVCTGSASFSAFPVSGAPAILLGHGVWGDLSGAGATVVYNDNYIATGGLRFGRADIESVNLATGTQPTLLVSQADAVFDLTPARDKVIYSWTVQPGTLAGLYVLSLP